MARPRTDIAPRILDAARKRFLLEGVEGASLRKIASDAETSIGMIYYYYPTKDDLFMAVVGEAYDQLMAELQTFVSHESTARDVLTKLAERLSALSQLETEIARLILGEALISSARFQRLMERFQGGHIALLLRTMLEGQKSGELRRDLSPFLLVILAIAALGPAQFVASKARSAGMGKVIPTAAETAAGLVRLLFEGIAAKDEGKRTPS
jgi:AcrR family transcriptional regulator